MLSQLLSKPGHVASGRMLGQLLFLAQIKLMQILTHGMPGKKSTNILKYFFQKIGYGISSELSPKETIRMKCQILFFGKNEKLSTVYGLVNLPNAW